MAQEHRRRRRNCQNELWLGTVEPAVLLPIDSYEICVGVIYFHKMSCVCVIDELQKRRGESSVSTGERCITCLFFLYS